MNTADTVKELKPLKAIIHGPPASGKTKLAKRLCQRYGAHYVSVKTMIDETLEDLKENIAREEEKLLIKNTKKKSEETDEKGDDNEDEDEDELGEEEETDDIEDLREQIKEITTLMAKSENGKLPDVYVVRLMRTFLVKDICQTRGYVLDGYPKTIQQAKELFGQAAETGKVEEGAPAGLGEPGEGAIMGGEDQIGGLVGNASNRIMPDFIVSLEATDEFLCERVMKLPEREIQGTHYDEKNMLRRLAEFRYNNMEDNTILKFFDEAGIHPILISLIDEETEEEIDFECILKIATDIFGEPIPGFGLTLEEEEELRRLELEQKRLQEEGDRIERQLKEQKATKEYQDKMEKWAETLEKLQLEEEKILAAQSEPLRFYLMKYIFPTLTKGLIEVAKIKPDDPVDYLAEFLFKENPEGKMFDPSYTRDGEKVIEQYEANVEQTLSKCANTK